MSIILFANNATSTLAGPISSGTTSANLAAGTGALFPSPTAGQYFVLTFTDAATGLINEIVHVTARSADAITIVRAQEGTTALNWLAGDAADNLWTAGSAASVISISEEFATNADTEVLTYVNATFLPVAGGTVNGNLIVNNGLVAYSPTSISLVIRARSSDGGSTIAFENNAQSLVTGSIVIDDAGNLALGATTFTVPSPLATDDSAKAATTGWVRDLIRIQLTGNTTFFVSPAGSDTNSGLTSGSPFLTIQHAVDVLQKTYDLVGFGATIQLADGTYAGFTVSAPMVGQLAPASLIINGNNTTPANVIINGGASDAAQSSGGQFQVQHCKLEALSGGGGCATAGGVGAKVVIGAGITFGASSQAKMSASQGGSVVIIAPYTDAGNASYHILATVGGQIVNGTTSLHTVTGTPTYSIGFAVAQDRAGISFSGSSGPSGGYTGSAIGNKYTVNVNATINTSGGGPNFFPGSIAGTFSTGGEYV